MHMISGREVHHTKRNGKASGFRSVFKIYFTIPLRCSRTGPCMSPGAFVWCQRGSGSTHKKSMGDTDTNINSNTIKDPLGIPPRRFEDLYKVPVCRLFFPCLLLIECVESGVFQFYRGARVNGGARTMKDNVFKHDDCGGMDVCDESASF